MFNVVRCSSIAMAIVITGSHSVWAQQPKPVIPHAQDKPPNEPRDPQTAAQMMTVPEGFSVEVVAAEPDIVNPVAMTIDERGRFWITESLEYPRREPGPGKDRVKILEDTDSDGKADKFTVFMEGLNIPSGIAVGHGGVWIANSPDILFVQDTDGDGQADKQEVVVTGFGRTDTHELPNSLTWGPDGWLYGLNGVFNHSHVKYPKNNPNYTEDHKGWPITCAMFRIHPKTREFRVFCEGTSNPWGIAFNDEGEAFVSACVIDHLWHLVETGYYHRQGGPYPPFTWKIDSIVKHKHQKAAYCGIHYFDSDAYPEQYRGKLYMGNIHGGCINVDRIERDGSTYKGFGEPDFLTANDAWFMPVVQKTGPDGSLYILDWYDRYHCYQDANRDPAGIDRLKGRLYRVRYKDTPRTPKDFNLAKESNEQLIERLTAKNDFVRWTATRLLHERDDAKSAQTLEAIVLDQGQIPSVRKHAFWARAGMSNLEEQFLDRILLPARPELGTLRAWAVRLLGDKRELHTGLIQSLWVAAVDRDYGVRLQVAIAQGKLSWPQIANPPTKSQTPMESWINVLAETANDRLIPHVIWQNLHPRLENDVELFIELIDEYKNHDDVLKNQQFWDFILRASDRILSRSKFDAKPVARIYSILGASPGKQDQLLNVISTKIETGELKGEKLNQLKAELGPQIVLALKGPVDSPQYLSNAFLLTAFGDKAGFAAVQKALETKSLSEQQRLAAAAALVSAGQESAVGGIAAILAETPPVSADFQGKLLFSLGKLDSPKVAQLAIETFSKMQPELQPKAIELLTQRASWAKQLLAAIADKKIPATAINLNQARRLKELKDEELTKLLATHWGQVREGRDPSREQYIASMKSLIRTSKGDAFAGEKAFKKVCAQCHKLYGEGAEVGPDITLNGRNDFTQLLSNVFDPSLVIGAGYRSYTVITNGGRVLNGLLAEDSPQRVVLKVQGGKQEVIARDDIDEFNVSEISLMPEQLEKQLSQQEIVDLFAFITLDKHPSDPSARRLPGVTQAAPRESQNSAEYAAIIADILPGFTTAQSGERGIAVLNNHFGRDSVLRTHPVSRDQPTILTMKLTPPADKKTKLIVDVSHDPRGDWRLVVRGNGERLADEMVSKETCTNGWRTITVDLSKFAGKELTLGLVNQANDWAWEFAYWGAARIISE